MMCFILCFIVVDAPIGQVLQQYLSCIDKAEMLELPLSQRSPGPSLTSLSW